MTRSLSSKDISTKEFDAALSRYEIHIPSKLTDLEELRLVTIPAALKERRENGSTVSLKKEELQQLVEWKLKHGTYRPTLAKLVASNSAEDIKSITSAAFREADKISGDDISTRSRDALNILVKLKGVGPATASLMLSTYDPERIPFFSDELFRWLHWNGKNASGITDGIKQVGKGWSRQIGYTLKEYSELCASNEVLRCRLKKEGREASSIEIEKVAYVLGKEQVSLDQATGAAEGGASELTISKDKEGIKTQTKSDTKRTIEKVTDADAPTKRQKKRTAAGKKTATPDQPLSSIATSNSKPSARSSKPK